MDEKKIENVTQGAGTTGGSWYDNLTNKPKDAEYINKMYNGSLESQKQTLASGYENNVSNIDASMEKQQKATDANLNRTYVESAKAAKNYGEVQNAYGLTSGAMANNGELFVLDRGKPVHILDLAENMIRLSGAQGIKIVETGLRPGEKLYEELLVKTEEMDKTENELIFIERDVPVTMEALEEKLELLRRAIATDDEETVRQAMKVAVPTYKSPQEQEKAVPAPV